jgi:hypothetical protein
VLGESIASMEDGEEGIEFAEPTAFHRFLLVAENGITLTVISFIASLLVLFLDGRWFVLLVPAAILGVHRSKGLEGIYQAARLFIYMVIVVVGTLTMWWIGIRVNESRDHIEQLIGELIKTVGGKVAKPQVSAAPPPPNSGPVVRFPALIRTGTPSWTLSQRPAGTIVELQYGNVGPATASRLRAGTKAIFGFDPPTVEMEDREFSKFVKGIPGNLKPAIDMESGNKSFIPNLVPELVGKRMEDLLNGREWLLLVGAITYSDATGPHRKGLCYYYWPMALSKALPLADNPLEQHWAVCQPKSLKRWEAATPK